MTLPLISIIMPVYNVEFYINEAIKSVLSQTYKQFELIIVEDGSTDKTAQIIKSFSDSRIIILTNKNNIGISGSLNRGLEYSKGSYIARADGDDISFPNRLEIQIKHLTEKNVDLVCSRYLNEDVETGEITESRYHEFTPNETKGYIFFYDIIHGAVMFKRNILIDLKPVYINRPAEDYDLFVRLAKKYKFYDIQENLVKVRVRRNSLCGKGWAKIKADINSIRIEQLSIINIHPTSKESLIHIALVDKNYQYLSEYSVKEIYNWIGKIIMTNNKEKAFPNPYFNDQWHLRAIHSLKYRGKRKISDIINYKYLSWKLGKNCNLRNLLYLYRYKVNSE